MAHKIKWYRKIHADHHALINRMGQKSGWSWRELFLFNDTWISTLDLWVTEVIPTILFSLLINSWWPIVFYYIWAAFFQELLEHRKKFNYYPFTAGEWHLHHHKDSTVNFGLFIPLWDKVFSTEYNHK